MKNLISAAFAAVLAAAAPAASASAAAPVVEWAGDSYSETAISACIAFNDYGPATLYEVVDDGVGDYLVWIEDTDGDLWLCNADLEGKIYAYEMMVGDLLEGAGAEYLGLSEISLTGEVETPEGAEQVCLALVDETGEAEVYATVPDGTGDYLVWIAVGESLTLCDASAYGEVYSVVDVGLPLNEGPDLVG